MNIVSDSMHFTEKGRMIQIFLSKNFSGQQNKRLKSQEKNLPNRIFIHVTIMRSMLFPQTGRFGRSGVVYRRLGFTIIELLIGMILFAGVSIAAYKVLTNSTRKAQEAQQNAKMSRGLQQFLEGFRHHIENTLQLPNGDASVLRVKRPARCVAIDESDEMGWTLVPMPGRNVSTINAAAYGPKDPSGASVNETDKGNDAVSMVYMPQETQINYLKINPGTDDPWPTKQASANDTIKVDTKNGLEVGDFAVISDVIRRDLIRITSIAASSCGGLACYEIGHNYTTSVWNRKMDYNYGEKQDNTVVGIPSLYRVNLETYALDMSENRLMKDTHLADDHFNVKTKTFGAKGLTLGWEPIADGITQFQLLYLTSLNTETRTPQAGIAGRSYSTCPGSIDCECENQLGLPNLKNIRVAIKYLKPESKDPNATDMASLSFNPLNLKTNLAAVEQSYPGCDTNEVLFMTLADGSPNPACEAGKSKNCLCADRCPLANCAGAIKGGKKGGGGGTDYGGGGSG